MSLLKQTSYLQLLLWLSLSSSLAQAQTVLPTTADPVKAAERFQKDPFARDLSDPLAYEKKQTESQQTESGRFVLGGVKIQGITIFKQDQFLFAYQQLLGKNIGKEEVDQIASAIGEVYRNQGYALAIAYPPAQRLENGSTLVIQVDEGRIGTVIFQGETPPDSVHQFLNRHIENIRSEVPLRSETLERQLLLINDLPGNIARAVLRPSASDLGATDLVIYYAHKPYDFALSSDNRGSRFLGPWQHTANVASNSLLGMDERLSLRGITSSPNNELRYIDLQYFQPLNTKGTKLLVMASHAETRPGESLKALNVQSDSNFVQVKAIHPYLRSRTRNAYARVTTDMRNVITDLGTANFTDDRIRSLRVGGSVDRSSDQSATVVDTEISQGIGGLGATDDGIGRSSRFGKHTYTKINLDVSHSHALLENISILLTGSGQYAFNPLLSSEQFVLGGPVYGTAYDPGELSGDHGVTGKAELRYAQTIDDTLISSYQLYSYYDVGAIWRKKTIGIVQSRESLASAGIGIRAGLGEKISLNLEYAKPLTRDLGSDRDNEGRIFGGMTYRH